MSFIQILRKCWTDLNFPLHWGRMFTGLAGIPRPLNRFETPQRLQWPAYWHDMGGPAGVQEHSFYVNSKILTSLPRRVVHGNSCSTSVAYHIIHQGGTKSLCCAVSSWLSSYWLRHGPVQHLWEQFTSQLWQPISCPGQGLSQMSDAYTQSSGSNFNQLWEAQLDFYASKETTHCQEWYSPIDSSIYSGQLLTKLENNFKLACEH